MTSFLSRSLSIYYVLFSTEGLETQMTRKGLVLQRFQAMAARGPPPVSGQEKGQMRDGQGSVGVWQEEQLIWGVPQGNPHIDDTETRPEGIRILTMPLLGNGQG